MSNGIIFERKSLYNWLIVVNLHLLSTTVIHYISLSSVKRSSFESLLNLRKAYIFQEVYYRSVFAESFKAFIFQKFRRLSCVARRPLCHKVNLPRCEARRRHFIITCNYYFRHWTNEHFRSMLFIRKNL